MMNKFLGLTAMGVIALASCTAPVEQTKQEEQPRSEEHTSELQSR